MYIDNIQNRYNNNNVFSNVILSSIEKEDIVGIICSEE